MRSYKFETAKEKFAAHGYGKTCEFVGLSGLKFVVRCKTCGHEFKRDQTILKKPQKKLSCPRCRDLLVSAALEYYQAGHSRFECAERFGLTPIQVQNYAKYRGVHGGMSRQERGELGKASIKKATEAAAKANRERSKANHERLVIRDNDKRIRKEWRDLNGELTQWRRTLKAINEIQSAKRIKQRLAAVSREINAMEVYEPKIATCKHCGKEWLFWPSREYYGRRCLPEYCSKKCLNKHYHTGTIRDRLRRLGRADEYRDVIPLNEVIKRDNGICYLCGCKTDKADSYTDANGYFVCGDTYPTRDHVIPIVKGGTHTWDNVRLACRKCNSDKNDRLLEEYKDEYALDLG